MGGSEPKASAVRRGRCHIGTSGWQYASWRGAFYPEDLPQRDWLACYAARFDTVEVNNSFYRLPSAEVFEAWRERAGPGFCFAVKFSRYGSHLKRLRDPEGPVERFLERARRLGPRLGPVLVQLPPRWPVDVERLARFLEVVPRPPRWCIEFRDPSWLCEPVYALLRRQGAALCIHDLIERHPREVTADFVYLRFHGDHYGGSYSPQQLSAEARRIAAHLRRGLDVHAYFNNDADGHAVANALDLRRYVARALRRPAPARAR
jgi:uncharacterized protein YecE (DUF72 family)